MMMLHRSLDTNLLRKFTRDEKSWGLASHPKVGVIPAPAPGSRSWQGE